MYILCKGNILFYKLITGSVFNANTVSLGMKINCRKCSFVIYFIGQKSLIEAIVVNQRKSTYFNG